MESELDYIEYRVALALWKWISPCLLVLGGVGNILCIVILTNKKTRGSSTAVYLTSLAVADLLVLYTGLLRQWVKFQFEIDIRHLAEGICKVHLFFIYFGTHCSSWFLVAVTGERFISACFPHKVKVGCTPKTAGIVITAIIICLAMLNVHWLYGYGDMYVTQMNNTLLVKCDIVFDPYSNFVLYIWPWIDLCVFALVPCCFLVIGNIGIIINVVLSKKRSATKVAPMQAVKNQMGNKTSHLTVMLLIINLVFFICDTPICIYLIVAPIWYANTTSLKTLAEDDLFWAVSNILMYTNHSTNFLMYCLSGTRFRGEVKALLTRHGNNRGLFTNFKTIRVNPVHDTINTVVESIA
ncbi:hypothetical protein CHS0354_029543 [Potamilus streckersoni]|uniref:G-protein coupled receptors family 1 profile domain-containing protein n=1 Tax=Potamilus streckersoni TaxID=2493646 RepID=A0AAE0SZN9_9BIVA|nr:hypothetical protein CHS0354_029543 [Potamilus streckersoni]